MTVRNLLIVNAILSIVSAVGLGLMPEQFVAPFGVTLEPGGAMLGRMYGGVLLGLALMCWLGRDLDTDGRRVLATGSAAGWTVFTIAMVLAIASNVASGMAVVWVAIGAVMALGGIGAVARVGVRE